MARAPWQPAVVQALSDSRDRLTSTLPTSEPTTSAENTQT
jgi:hypothetical protein